MDDFLTPPPGWRYAAYPWFARDTAPDLPRLVQVGRVLLPEFFHLAIGTEDAWVSSRLDGSTYVEAGSSTVLFLDFQVFDDEIDMAHATSVFFDLPEVYERVRKVVRPNKWKQLGIHYMLRYLAEFTEEEGRPDTDVSAYGGMDSISRRPEVALEWLDRLQTHAADAYAEARGTPPPKRKRVKLTDEFLQEVARVYRVAENSEMPPTREVATHFKAPHSTAAKWVAATRRRKFLPPAESASNEAARSAVRQAAQ